MRDKRRSALASSVTLAFALLLGSSAVLADPSFDAGKLPRIADGKEVYASLATAIFTVPVSVKEAGDGTMKVLRADGWQSYGPISASQSNDPNMFLASLKKGAQGLSLFITVAPAQNNATSVTYNGMTFTHELPFPKDATDIRFEDYSPHLACSVASSVEAASDFFRTELLMRGWSPWSKEQGAKAAFADVRTEKGIYAYYVHDQQKPLILTLARDDSGKTAVNLESIDPDLIVAKKPEDKPAPPAAPDKSQTADKMGDAFDALTNDLINQAKKSVADALSGSTSASPPPAADESAPEADLATLSSNPAPIPVPSTSQNVSFDSSNGKLEFDTPSSIPQVAAFYRKEMKALGWTEQKSVINQTNVVVLEFHKGEQEVSLTAMKMGPSVNVTATGSALEVASNTANSTTDDVPAPAADDTKDADAPLEAEMTGGLPIPKDHSSSGTEGSMFRHGANASTSAKLKSVLAFYRQELSKLGWTEDASKADIKPDAATLHFTSADGPAVLTLGRANGETSIALVVRDEAKAKKSGMMAQPGQVKLLFGNILDTPATITIAGKTITVKGGAGSKGPDGPTLEIAPGKYAYTIRGTGNDAPGEPVVVGADEIWGIMLGPGGVLPLQMY